MPDESGLRTAESRRQQIVGAECAEGQGMVVYWRTRHNNPCTFAFMFAKLVTSSSFDRRVRPSVKVCG